MKLVVGLGNPGEKYKNTRHNVGFMVIDELEKHKDDLGKVMLVKPMKFMNKSGDVVARIKNFHKIGLDDVYVVHDDLDIRLGEYKIQKGVGPKVHNGVNSVEQELGSKEFWRVRVGVDGRGLKIGSTSEQSRPESRTVSDEKPFELKTFPMRDFSDEKSFRISGEDYVLGRFRKEEQKIIDEVVEKIVKEIKEKLCI